MIVFRLRQYYNLWLSLLGGVMCTAIMFLIQWWTGLLTVAIIIILYLVVAHRKPEVNWGSSTQAQTYTLALNSVASLGQVEEHVKTYRPQILVLCGAPSARPPLLHFANSITKNMSLLVAGHCLKEQQPHRVRARMTTEATKWLVRGKIRAFYPGRRPSPRAGGEEPHVQRRPREAAPEHRPHGLQGQLADVSPGGTSELLQDYSVSAVGWCSWRRISVCS
ncbi:sodium-chloride cotransporter isoform 1 [Penaeus vannamei]|uniref:Sodium-chloride cotransporter isoform 1 n=1 Tax=Penaeus vannamei TaxID=6689 RepID=A0A3R7N8Z4_PENVA|nr:sodium-chloride cotransporter isoform 1 [Penaeus vannamei]